MAEAPDEILAGLDNAMTTTDPAENARICTDKMRELVKLAMIYSDDAGTRYFPYSPEGGVASLQILADFFTDRVKPDMLICPESEDVPAVAGPDGKLKLTRENCSFGMVPKKLDPGDLDDVLTRVRIPPEQPLRASRGVKVYPTPQRPRVRRGVEGSSRRKVEYTPQLIVERSWFWQ